LLPPGQVYLPAMGAVSLPWMLGSVVAAAAALGLARWSLLHCDASLRRWYAANHGVKAAD
jgi:hypothetical protein